MVNENEVIDYLTQLENEINALSREKRQLTNAQLSLFGNENEENLIKWQLDLKEDLDKIYHLLKGHQVKQDEQGNTIYVEPTDDRLKPFNEFGVQLIMNVISFYLNRNTILSNYDEETIKFKVKDFGSEIKDLIFVRYEDMGMDTMEKRKMYFIIVRELIDVVHSAYLRAYNGGERNSLRTARTVTQNEPIGRMPNYPMVSQQTSQRNFKLFNPTTWFRT